MIERTLPIASTRQVRRAIWTAVRPDRKLAAAATVLLIIAASIAATSTRVLGMVIDEVTTRRDPNRLDTFGIALVAGMAIAGVCGLAGRRILARVAERSLARLRHEAFDASMQLRLHTIERVGTADPLARLTGDIGNLTDGAHEIVPVIVTLTLASTLAATGLLLTAPILALAACTGLPILAYFIVRCVRRIRPLNLAWMESAGEVTRVIHEISDGGRTIRIFRATNRWRDRLDSAVQREWELEWPTGAERNRLYPSAHLAQATSLTSVLVVSMLVFHAGWLSLGVVSAGSLFVIQAFLPLGYLFEMLEKVQIVSAAMSRVVGVSLARPQKESTNTVSRIPIDGRVELRNVHFAYPKGGEVLRGIDISIASGERVAVVGGSGAGKSTIAKLVAGIYAPTNGEVLLGGVPVHELDEADDRRFAVLVTQESHVFIGTVGDNCRLARPSATDADLQRVLETVHAWDWVNTLPDKLDTRVGRGGNTLTLIQAQQLALARVLLVDPLVVILDEATASLGSQTARGIERSFGAVLEGRTVITIAHRLDVAAEADRVAVIDHGTADIDAHDELIGRNHGYASMWNHWLALRQ